MGSTGGPWLRPLYLKTYPTRPRSQRVSEARVEEQEGKKTLLGDYTFRITTLEYWRIELKI